MKPRLGIMLDDGALVLGRHGTDQPDGGGSSSGGGGGSGGFTSAQGAPAKVPRARVTVVRSGGGGLRPRPRLLNR